MKHNVIVNHFFDGYKIHNTTYLIKTENGLITEITDIEEDKADEMATGKSSIDLRNKFVTPGLIDTHNHFMLTALKLEYQIDLADCTSFADIISTIKEHMGNIIHGWLQAYGLNEYQLREKILPDRYILDKIVKDVPLFITSFTEHYAVCNSKALNIAGIDESTENPQNGKIGRDVNDIPDGRLYESQAMDIVKKHIPEYGLDDYENAIIKTAEKYLNSGLTVIKDTGGTGRDINEDVRIEAFNKLSTNNKIRLRIVMALPVYNLQDVDKKIEMSNRIKENEYVKNGGFKLFLDGTIMSRTAWMKHNYKKQKDDLVETSGMPLWDINDFKEALYKLASTGKHISIHVIGTRAVSVAVEAIREIERKGTDATFAFVHAYILTKHDQKEIDSINELGIALETQATDIYFIGYAIHNNLDEKDLEGVFPIHTLIKKGILLSNGSDSPVTPFNPVFGLYSSIYRKIKDYNGKNYYDNGENIDFETSLKTYTAIASKVLRWDKIGNIKPGYFADLLVWDNCPFGLGEDINGWTSIKLKVLKL